MFLTTKYEKIVIFEHLLCPQVGGGGGGGRTNSFWPLKSWCGGYVIRDCFLFIIYWRIERVQERLGLSDFVFLLEFSLYFYFYK